jgi:hypothetical protein
MNTFSRIFRQKRTHVEFDLTDQQIDQLRAVIDRLPLDPYASLVVAMLKKLPLEADASRSSGADVDPQAPPLGALRAASTSSSSPTREKPALSKVVSRLPHTGDL